MSEFLDGSPHVKWYDANYSFYLFILSKLYLDCVKADMNACSLGGIDSQKQNRLEIRY